MRAFVAAALLAAPAAAQDKVDRDHGKFFNKPGATADQLAGDATECRAIADGAESQVNAINVLAGGVGGILGGIFAGNRLKRVNVENCMVIRGWRLFALTQAEGVQWKALSEPQRQAELATLAGADSPARGRILREWKNNYAEPVLWPKD